jgi:Dehydrogenases with different specificities (related to short-chain alcohol dehydrogenases)
VGDDLDAVAATDPEMDRRVRLNWLQALVTTMTVQFDFSDSVVLVTGVGGALGSAVAEAFLDADATVCGTDVVAADDEDFLLDDTGRIDFYRADFTDESAVADTVESVVAQHGGLDYLANVAGTWRGGDPVHETDVGLFDLLFDVNLKTTFLGAKHAIPHIRERGAQSSTLPPGPRCPAVRVTRSTERARQACGCSRRVSPRRTRGLSGQTRSCRASSTRR